MHEATHATNKPVISNYGGAPTPPASVPNISGGKTDEDGCVYGEDGGDNRCSVTVTSGPSLPPDIERAIDVSSGNMPLGNREDLAKAVIDAETILSANGRCAKFFQNVAVAKKALKAFEQKAKFGKIAETRTGIEMTEDSKNPNVPYNSDGTVFSLEQTGKAAYRIFGVITINTYGPFSILTEHSPTIGGYNDMSRESRVLQVLHELAHMVLDKNAKPLIEDDGRSPGKSSANTKLVSDECKAEIDALKKEN